MGIHGLMKLLTEECPQAIKEVDMEGLTGRKVAIDASMAMYQFLVAVRSNGPGGAQASMQLTNEAGEVTSHIQGMFNRTIKMLSSGVKPVYIFDGKPPELKGGELAKRIAKRAKAESDLAAAKEAGDTDDMDKFSRRLVKVTRQHNEDCKQLLRLMGVPVVDAPCEAEAQCAELAKKGKVYATATEDMDALTFRTPKLLRKLTFSQGKEKQPIIEIDVEVVLTGLGLTYEQFVDLCILCGCDYCSSIKSVGPKTALRLIREYKTLERIVAAIKRDKKLSLSDDWVPTKVLKQPEVDVQQPQLDASVVVVEGNPEESPVIPAAGVSDVAANEEAVADAVEADEDAQVTLDDDGAADSLFNNAASGGVGDDDPEEETANAEQTDDADRYEIYPPMFTQARKLFLQAPVTPAEEIDLRWTEPDEEALRSFLVEKMGFNLERVNNGIKKLQEAQQKKAQKRLDSFFKPVAATSSSTAVKRKADEPAKGAKGTAGNKAAKGGFPKKR